MNDKSELPNMTPDRAAQILHDEALHLKSFPAINVEDKDAHETKIQAFEFARDVMLRMPAYEKNLEELRKLRAMFCREISRRIN